MNRMERQNYRENEAVLPWRQAVGAARGDEGMLSFERGRNGIAAWIIQETVAAWAACGAFEWVALGYLAISSALIAVFAANLAPPVKLIGVQAVVAAMILLLCTVEAPARQLAATPR